MYSGFQKPLKRHFYHRFSTQSVANKHFKVKVKQHTIRNIELTLRIFSLIMD